MKKFILLLLVSISLSLAQAQEVIQEKETEVFKIVKDIPVFPGCENEADWTEKYSCNENAIYNHIQSEIKYPKEAFEKKQEGVIYISFLVSKIGQIENINITKGLTFAPSLEREAIRVITTLPKMIMGKTKGRVVAVKYTQIIRFYSDETGKEEELVKKIEINTESKKERRNRLRKERRAK